MDIGFIHSMKTFIYFSCCICRYNTVPMKQYGKNLRMSPRDSPDNIVGGEAVHSLSIPYSMLASLRKNITSTVISLPERGVIDNGIRTYSIINKACLMENARAKTEGDVGPQQAYSAVLRRTCTAANIRMYLAATHSRAVFQIACSS